ncbi:MAG TPA: heavy metal translocating P-type ATPase [Gemmatimonadaceae bacterium]|nr:heavy metal translocating P-type ATPase [Gemmatimonadaceae bacterium]
MATASPDDADMELGDGGLAVAPTTAPTRPGTPRLEPPPAVAARRADDRWRAAWREYWRALALPIAALAFLLAGGAAWFGGQAEWADRIWMVGLVATGAVPVWRTTREALRGQLATDIVATLAIVTAVAIGHPFAGLVIVLMLTGGEALDLYAAGRASAAVRELEAAAPRIAHRSHADGTIEDVAAEAVAVGDVLLVRPGELVPCDGVVIRGRSHVDASRLTGEPVPITAESGTALLSGSANQEGPLIIRATAVARESQYLRIVDLVRSAQASKAPLQRLADRYAVWFTPATLLVCVVAWLVSRDMERVLAVLVVATPCPLILATPIAMIGGINRAAARQIIVRSGGALEQLAAVTVAVFDKTGTITLGRPEVQRVELADGWAERDVLRLAGAVEQGSGHLLARSLVDAAVRALAGTPLPAATEVVEVPGRGVSGRVEGRRVTVGARSLVAAEAPADGDLAALDARFAEAVGLRAYVAVDGRVVGVVDYADQVRREAHTLVDELRRLGIHHTVLLSGDHAANVRAVADTVGVTSARGDLLPEQKVEAVRALMAAGEQVVMVGDGTNDAPALSTAHVGVAMAGAAGQGGGITAEAADVVILADDLGRLADAVRIGRRTMRVARQSLVVGLGLSVVAMVVASLGYIPPAVGALLQEGIDVAVIVNALRASR